METGKPEEEEKEEPGGAKAKGEEVDKPKEAALERGDGKTKESAGPGQFRARRERGAC